MLRTAIIGTGGIGTHLAREVREHPEGQIAAAVDVNEDALADLAAEHDLDESVLYTDEAEMYETTDLDAVIVATPPAFHDDQIHEAFDRGLHVLCEKPVVIEQAAAQRLRDRVAESDLVFMAGYQRHLNPGFVAAYDRYHDEGQEPTFMTGELTQDWTGHFERGTNWRVDPDIGGRGHLFSVGTHVLESVLWLSGLTPTAVSAEMDFYDDEQYIDTKSSLTVRFENGAVASFADSAVAPATREHIHVWDDEGAMYLEGVDWGQRHLTVVDADGSERTPELAYDEAPSKFAAFAEAIETGDEPPATAEDVLVVTALLDAAYESARTGERVTVDLE
ncbi:Gfo/Idh/MocA family protein [Halosimplex salinum]|uniref:Gfo/Idh/MocA family protein n=1 Tax=Halosimplex salinum TaxID=1710538 RepID=UPI000F480946|nr:Gfo/Idh/MocA family oxidoreductase [Halosimplex salinum]